MKKQKLAANLESKFLQEKQLNFQINGLRSVTPKIDSLKVNRNIKNDESQQSLNFLKIFSPSSEADQNIDQFKSYRQKSLQPLNYSDQMIQKLAIKHYEAGKRIIEISQTKNESQQLPKDQLKLYEMGNTKTLNYNSKFKQDEVSFAISPIEEVNQVRNVSKRKQNIVNQLKGRSIVTALFQQKQPELQEQNIKKEVIENQKNLISMVKLNIKQVLQKKIIKNKYLLDTNTKTVIEMLDNMINQNQIIDKSDIFQGNIERPKNQNKDMKFQPNIYSQKQSLEFSEQAYPKEIDEFVKRRLKYIQQKQYNPRDYFIQRVNTSIKDCQLHSIPSLQQTLQITQKIFQKKNPQKIFTEQSDLKCCHKEMKNSLVDECVQQYKQIVRWIVNNSFQLRRHKSKNQIIEILKNNSFFDMQNLSEEEALIFENPDACIKILSDPLLHLVKKDIRLLEKEEQSKGLKAPQTELIINQDRQPTSYSIIQKERGALKQTGLWREILQFLTSLSPHDDLTQNHFLKQYFDETQVVQPNGLIDSSKQTINQLKEQIFQKKKPIQKIEEQNEQTQSFSESEDLREKRVSFPFLISGQANQYVKELAQYFQEQDTIKNYKIQKCLAEQFQYNPQYTPEEIQQQKLICLSILSFEKIDTFCLQLEQQLEDFYTKFIIKKKRDNSDDDGDYENDFVRRKITQGKYPIAMREQRRGRTIEQGHIFFQAQQDSVFEQQFTSKQLYEQAVIKQEFWQLSKTYLNDFYIQKNDFGQTPHVNKYPLLIEILQMFDQANQKPSTLFLDFIENKKLIIGSGVFRDIDIDVLCKYITEIPKICPKESVQIFEARNTKFKNHQLQKILSALQQIPRLQKLLLHKQSIQRQEA